MVVGRSCWALDAALSFVAVAACQALRWHVRPASFTSCLQVLNNTLTSTLSYAIPGSPTRPASALILRPHISLLSATHFPPSPVDDAPVKNPPSPQSLPGTTRASRSCVNPPSCTSPRWRTNMGTSSSIPVGTYRRSRRTTGTRTSSPFHPLHTIIPQELCHRIP